MLQNANLTSFQKIVFFVLVLSIGILFLRVVGSLLFDISRYTGWTTLPWYQGETTYEYIRLHSGSGDLDRLKNTLLPGYEGDRMELIGDSLHVQGYPSEESILWYERSLAEKSSPRVEAKIAILLALTGSTESTNDLSESGASAPDTLKDTPSLSSGSALEIENAESRIRSDSENRDLYLEKSLYEYGLRDAINNLQTPSFEQIDW